MINDLTISINAQFSPEHRVVLGALSRAATAYAEAILPEFLSAPAPELIPYLNRAVALTFCYAAPRRQPIVLADGYGVFPPVQHVPLCRPVVSPAGLGLVDLDMSRPEGVALESALVAMSELLVRVEAALVTAADKRAAA